MAQAITSDGFKLYWTGDGPANGPAVLLINSVGASVDMWAPQAAALSSRYRLIRFDARGHGQSDAPDADYGLERLGLDALAVLDAAGVGQADICGLSLGGLTAQWIAVHRPARLRRLVLANTASRIGGVEGWNQRIDAVRKGGLASIADMALGRFFSPAFAAAHPEAVEPVRQALLTTPADGYIGACAALRDADLTADVGGVVAPTLVIGGTLDVSTPPVQTGALAAAIPGARHQLLDAAHLSNIEQPEAFSAAVLQHLEA